MSENPRRGGGVLSFLSFPLSAFPSTAVLGGRGRAGPVPAVPRAALVAAAAHGSSSGAPPLSPPRGAPPAPPQPPELPGGAARHLSGKGNGVCGRGFGGCDVLGLPPRSGVSFPLRACVRLCARRRGGGSLLRARGGREQCDGSGRPCAEGSSPRMCAEDRGGGAGLGGALAACGGARRATAAPGSASAPHPAPPGGASPGGGGLRGAAGGETSRGEQRSAAGPRRPPAAEVGRVPSRPPSIPPSPRGRPAAPPGVRVRAGRGPRRLRWRFNCSEFVATTVMIIAVLKGGGGGGAKLRRRWLPAGALSIALASPRQPAASRSPGGAA